MTTKLHVRDFGDALIETQDLDPVYVGLVRAELPEPQLCRWLLAYWCFYHVGTASWLSEMEGARFWSYLGIAAVNVKSPKDFGLPSDRWPRAAERRHFRGQKCVDAVDWLSISKPLNFEPAPESWVRSLSEESANCLMSDKLIMSRVQKWPLFGPWISFKAADMMERVYGTKVQFDPNIGLMYEEPSRALSLLARGPWVKGEDPKAKPLINANWDEVTWYHGLLTYFSARRAPPRGDRYCGPQEVETVLCKWKSYMGGHYHIGKDIHEQRQALAGWGATAERINKVYPSEVAAGRYA